MTETEKQLMDAKTLMSKPFNYKSLDESVAKYKFKSITLGNFYTVSKGNYARNK